MLISRLSEETGTAHGDGVAGKVAEAVEQHVSPATCRSASEVFDLMTKNRHFDENDDDSITTQDLVLLYKNLDIGSRLISDATEVRRRKPNQRVETVVYDEPESDSEISENYSKEDIHNIYKINQERINLLDNGSFDNVLCHKLGDLRIQPSEMIAKNSKQFLFRDPVLKAQFQNLNTMTNGCQLPASLLDYVCCRRLKDNYNFYMDNIIKHVQHTIEQLKRISNGDYLTDRTKEKWEKANKLNLTQNSTKVLASSTSVPVHVECNRTVIWHDVVHSEIDLLSLSKILEKKIVLEIPKLICGSYRLFCKRCDSSLIITCKREKQDRGREDETRLDVVLKLQRSQTGQVIKNTNSIKFLKASPAGHNLRSSKILAIAHKPPNNSNTSIGADLKHNRDSTNKCYKDEVAAEPVTDTKVVINEIATGTISDNTDNVLLDTANKVDYNDTKIVTSSELVVCESDSNDSIKDILVAQTGIFEPCYETTYNLISPDELRLTMQRLSMQKAVPEEGSEGNTNNSNFSVKKLSPVKVRIKSPYENKSYILEEKKRKKLIEIREKRAKRKIALSENAKVSKHRYGKPGVAPQASVTKLSISNKSFYNSIYGHGQIIKDDKQKILPCLKSQKSTLDNVTEEKQDENHKSIINKTPPVRNSKKYINRSYYLDDADTEMMYMEIIEEDNKDTCVPCSASASAGADEFKANLSLLSQFTGMPINETPVDENQSSRSKNKIPLESKKNRPVVIEEDDECKGAPVTVECRKSIEKLYNLIRKIEKSSNTDSNHKPKKLRQRTQETSDVKTVSSVPASTSGTSLKHYISSSNPSSFSFEKIHSDIRKSKGDGNKEPVPSVVPKVIISSRVEKLEADKLKKGRKKNESPPGNKTVPDNPLKAISQLLQEVDNVQKIRQKPTPEPKPVKKPDVQCNDGRPFMIRHTLVKRRSRFDQYILKEKDVDKNKTKDKRTKPLNPTEMSKISQQHVPVDDKAKKKIADIIDEAKEARGEAVRGPSKPTSRLMTLAQPKRTYVQAHSEEYQIKYGRTLMADRLQRLAATLPPPPTTSPDQALVRNITSPTIKNRMRREATSSSMSVKQSIDKSGGARRSSSNSPHAKSVSPIRSSLKAPEPENLIKMVAVESYVKNHYGRFRKSCPAQLRDEMMHKSRVPLIPNDIELSHSSASTPITEEANKLGNELHHIIDYMITSAPVLSTLAEDHENNSKINPNLQYEITNSIPDEDFNNKRTDSDFDIDVLDDKTLKTAVQRENERDKQDDDDISDIPQDDVLTSRSATELGLLENALYTQLSGAFQKRLRLKNLTLTPKPSPNHVFLLQSGDTKSVIVKSTVPNDTDLKAVSMLNSHLNWDFTQIPMQVATVGYAFPVIPPENGSKHEIATPRRLSTSASELCYQVKTTYKSDKINQCFQGVHQETNSQQLAQVDGKDILMKTTFNNQPTFTVSELGGDSFNHLDNVNTRNMSIEKLITVEKSKAIASSSKQSTSTIHTGISTTENYLPESVEYTTSLDILVGLLNEIQKITCPNPIEEKPTETEMENILSNAVALEANNRDMMSMTSFDKFDYSTGIYSFYISNSVDKTKYEQKPPACIDKEVSANLNYTKKLKNSLTDVPSVFPIVINHGTSATNSMIGVITQPSTQSMVSCDDYQALYSNTLYSSHSAVVHTPVVKKNKEVKKTDLNEKYYEIVPQNAKPMKGNKPKAKSVVKIKSYPITKTNLDPSIKIKREILVTVYSILVFTVFAALSFPDMALFIG